MTAKTAAKSPARKATKAPAKKTAAKKTAKTAAKKSTAKKAPAKKTVAKKTTARRRPARGKMDVKMIHTIDSGPGRDTRVFFTDGTNAVVKRGTKLDKMLSKSETHAPALLKVTMDSGHITDVEPVKADASQPEDTSEKA